MLYQLSATAYSRIGAPDYVIDWIINGVRIPFKDKPNKCFYSNRVKGKQQEAFVDSQVGKLVQEGSLKEVNHKPQCVLALQCVPKKNQKLRLVVDCRPVNVNIDSPSFTQEGLKAVSQLIKPQDQLILIDVQDGFHHVSICEEHQTYFGIKWRNKFYVWSSLCFGISCAPYFFYKTLRPVVQFFRENNIRLANFVDDFLFMLEKFSMTDHIDFVLQTFKDLGWCLNFEKCDLIPSTEKVFVGFRISTHRPEGPWISVLPQKIHKLRRCIMSDREGHGH